MKAMNKDAAERYDSGGELGGDVARFLSGEPVLARGPSAAYVLRRLAARNKTVVAVSPLALLACRDDVGRGVVAATGREAGAGAGRAAVSRGPAAGQSPDLQGSRRRRAAARIDASPPDNRRRGARLSGAAGTRVRIEHVTLRLELAAAYRQIGGILGDPQRANLGDRDGALRQYERARAIVLPLATETAHYDVVSALSRIDTPLSTLNGLRSYQARAIAIAREAVDYAARYHRLCIPDD